MKPPMIVLVVGISLMPKIGTQTQKIPPTTSVKDNKVRSAAGKFLEPIELRIRPEHTKVPCNAEREEFLKVVKTFVSLIIIITKEIIAQNNPANETVVKVGVLLFHLKETEPTEKPKADKRPANKPNKVPIWLLLKAIKIIPAAAKIIAIKVVKETFSLRKIYPRIAVINGIAANINRVTAAEVWVIDQIKPIKAVAKPNPPITTDKSIFL